MTIAVMARADQGGLGAQTLEMARHLGPSKILIVDLQERGRGKARPERFHGLGADVQTCLGNPKAKHLDWLCDGVHAIYTAEGTYGDQLPYIAAQAGVRLVVHANPELWSERSRDATTEVVLPTNWEAQRVPGSSIMPMPVDRDRLRFRRRTRARTFWHPAAPAMCDRNGTEIVTAAFAHVRTQVRVILTGTGRTGVEPAGNVLVEHRPDREDYWEGYDTADVLLLPRRYGGLSLPVQEALSAGMPVVMLETGPYAGQGGVVTIPCSGSYEYPMKGGRFDVHDGDPRVLAAMIDRLAADDMLVERLSDSADAYAQSLAWSRWQAPWRELLERP